MATSIGAAPGGPEESAQLLPGVIGTSACMRVTVAQVSLIAESEGTCLLLGETGTGKELFARAIHYTSRRAQRQFVPVNCGAIADSLFESELFGHIRGAFTDARTEEIGLLAYADHGTLFLDEVDTLSPSAQVKLLRVLQEREYRPVGSAKTCRVDVRIVAATNSDLRRCIALRSFREDLFHRLNVLRLTIPPLRDRIEDIPLLARHFLREFGERQGQPCKTLHEQAVRRLMAYHWPGNVRELESVLQRASLLVPRTSLSAGDLELADEATVSELPSTLKAAKMSAIQQFERSYLYDILRRFEGNVSHAAKAAGKERSSFQRLLRKHSIAAEGFRA